MGRPGGFFKHPARTLRRALAGATLLLGAALAAVPAETGGDEGGTVAVLTVEGAIGPATAGYIKDEIDRAEKLQRELVVLKIDTPGGLSRSMREIISRILASQVPVATYVAPRGARAASAGTYILYASHVAAMAPSTTLGAATPVQMGGGGGSPLPGGGGESTSDGKNGGTSGETKDSTGGRQAGDGTDPSSDRGAPPADAKKIKALNDAIAYIRTLAELRGRNADWAEKAVAEAATLTVDRAVAKNVVDLKATGLTDLLATIDGQSAQVGDRSETLATQDARVEDRPMDWRDELLTTITNPNIAFIFMMLGVYGLIFELSNPGAVLPGVLGGICLLTGLYALNVLPVNYAGLALIGLGIAFMTAEAFAPSFGALGLGGLAAFALGSTILFDTGSAAYALSYWTIAGVTATTGAILVLLIGYLVQAQRRHVMTGAKSMIGMQAQVVDWAGDHGHVTIRGERWNAHGPANLQAGQTVEVTDLTGLTVEVSPCAPSQRPQTVGGSI